MRNYQKYCESTFHKQNEQHLKLAFTNKAASPTK